MSVYVDEALIEYGRMQMSHMVADSSEELLAMVDAIGVPRRWIQKAGTHREHFDICKAKREKAIAAGAIPVDGRDIMRMMRGKVAAW